MAAHNGHLPVVKLLIAHGADLNIKTSKPSEWTPLTAAIARMQVPVALYLEEILQKRDYTSVLQKRLIREGIPEDKAAEYVKLFKENELDTSLFEEITDQVLEKIGIFPIGHRLKILKILKSWNEI